MFLSKLFKYTRARVMTALAGLTMVLGAAATISTVSATQQNEVVETKAATLANDQVLVITHAETWYIGAAAVWYWGDGLASTCVEVVEVSNECGYVILPLGVTGFKVLRTDISLPSTEYPGDNHHWNETGDISFNSSYNWVALTGNSGAYTYNSTKTCIPNGTTIFFDAAAWEWGNWDDAGAVPFMAAWLDSTWYNVQSGTTWCQMTEVGSTNLYYYTATSDMILDGLAFTRNSNSSGGWNTKWSQTTDITAGYGFNPFYITYLKGEQTEDGKENWLVGDKTATATAYGTYFLDKISCNDGVTAPSVSNWNAAKGLYDGLGLQTQGVLWTTAHASSGTNLVLALERYDYIISKYGTSSYSDYINRKSTGGGYTNNYGALAVPYIKDNVSPLTTTLWIVLGTGILGLGAIGAAYFISKKKKHQA